jgi:bifunctional DNA-binding transcriptional regulator/antitoxin component of YhaV-PrlF toxin-antitoxin module
LIDELKKGDMNNMEEIKEYENIVTIQKDGSVQIPDYIRKKWNIKSGDSIYFEFTPKGMILQKTDEIFIEIGIPMEWHDKAKDYIQKKNLNMTINDFFEEAVKKHLEYMNTKE